MRLSEVTNVKDVFDYPAIVLYGLPGIGKTTLACLTLPKPLLYIDTENSCLAIMRDEIIKEYKEELDQIYWERSDNVIEIKNILKKYSSTEYDFKSICIDTYTYALDRFMHRELIAGVISPQSFKLKYDDWGQVRACGIDIFTSMLLLYRKSYKVIIMAERIFEPTTSLPRYLSEPDIQGRSGDKMHQMFSEIWRLYKTPDGAQVIQTDETIPLIGGGRYSALVKSRIGIKSNSPLNFKELLKYDGD